MSEIAYDATVLIEHGIGLHARPSVKLTKLAKKFDAQIELAIEQDGPWIDAKSIVKVMAMKAPKGTLLHFRAKGRQAQIAIDTLVELVENNFYERGGKV
ncbi:MAG: HPr family phosphocarrier protein [Stappiaceae bacterium]